jgi:hypothetical protein
MLLQASAGFEVTLIDDGSVADHVDRLPVEFAARTIRHAQPLGFVACVDQFIAEHCKDDDIVVVLAQTRGFSGAEIAARVLNSFQQQGCELLYGQYRTESGRHGRAVPACSAIEFPAVAGSAPGRAPLFFRARLWREIRSRQGSPVMSDRVDAAMYADLMLEAGFDRTYFMDDVLTLEVDEQPRLEPPLLPPVGNPDYSLKVSCLMVTRDRVAMAKRAIRCFASQTYAARELIVVCDGEARVSRALRVFVDALRLDTVRFVDVPISGLSLGSLRNRAMEAATGEVVCQWDDDDCSHPDRIRLQLDHMLEQGARACLLSDHLQFLEDDSALRWVDWTLGGSGPADRLAPGTLMMMKDDQFRYPEEGPHARRGEDTVMLRDLCQSVPVVGLPDAGYLYLYTYHGRNTHDAAHHRQMGAFGRTVAEMRALREPIGAAMSHFSVPKPYLVLGRDGPAYVLDE